MAKNINRTPWIFDAAGQMEGKDTVNTFRTYSTFTAATSDVVTINEHGLGAANAVGGPIRVSTSSALPAGLSAGKNYWYRVIDRDTFKLYATELAAQTAGTAVDITDTGTGTHTMSAQNVYKVPIYIEQIKLDTGDGGDFLLTETSDAQDRVLKLDSTPANDTLWIPVNHYVEALYVQTLASNASMEVYVGDKT